MILLVLPGLNDLTNLWEFERKDENRSFKDELKISIANLDAFPAEAEEYINDNFSFRAPLIDLNNYTKFKYFEVSPSKDKTLVGKDGWYFMAGKEKDIYEGKLDFSDEDLNILVDEWKYRKGYLDSSGIEAYWLIAPFKHNIYPEQLPRFIRKSENRRIEKLKEELDEFWPELLIDPAPQLIAAKDTTKTFYQLDNHWNLKAGNICSEILRTRMSNDFPDSLLSKVPECTWIIDTLQKGYHHKAIGIEDLMEIDYQPEMKDSKATELEKYGFPCIDGFAYCFKYEERFENENSNLRVLIIRDSFGNQMEPFLKEMFQESVFIWDAWFYNLNEEIIETVKPDVVLFITLETHIDNIVDQCKKKSK